MNSHDPHDRALAARMADDPELRDLRRRLFDHACAYRYTYNFTWLGRPIIQFPEDMVAVQEILWKVRPDLVVETGIAHGGSLLLSASVLELIGHGRVLGVDIDIRAHNRDAIESHPLAGRIDMIEGSSINPVVVERVKAAARGCERVVVLLDSNHTHAHVQAELAAYSPLVRKGSYLVVFDTVIEHMSPDAFPDRLWGRGDNPLTAVREFLAGTNRFRVDREIEDKLLMSVAPEGYLVCVED